MFFFYSSAPGRKKNLITLEAEFLSKHSISIYVYLCDMCLHIYVCRHGYIVYVWQSKYKLESLFSPFTIGSGIKALNWSSCL